MRSAFAPPTARSPCPTSGSCAARRWERWGRPSTGGGRRTALGPSVDVGGQARHTRCSRRGRRHEHGRWHLGDNHGLKTLAGRTNRVDEVTYGVYGDGITARELQHRRARHGHHVPVRAWGGSLTQVARQRRGSGATSRRPQRRTPRPVTAVRPTGGVPTAGGLLTVVGSEFAHRLAQTRMEAILVWWGSVALDVQARRRVGSLRWPAPDCSATRTSPCPTLCGRPIDGVSSNWCLQRPEDRLRAATDHRRRESARAITTGGHPDHWRLRVVVSGRSFGVGGAAHIAFIDGTPVPPHDVIAWDHEEVTLEVAAQDSASVAIEVTEARAEWRGGITWRCDQRMDYAGNCSIRDVATSRRGATSARIRRRRLPCARATLRAARRHAFHSRRCESGSSASAAQLRDDGCYHARGAVRDGGEF